MAYGTFTLTGTYTTPAGEPHTGNVKVSPSVTLRDAAGKVVMAGPVTATLVDGVFSLTLPAADDSLQPQPHGFTVIPRLHAAALPYVSFAAPAPGSTVDVADLDWSTPVAPAGEVAATVKDLTALGGRVTVLEASATDDATTLAAKADQSYVDTQLATKADGAAITDALALKADASALSALSSTVATKADAAATTTALAAKADGAATSTALALKADATALAAKADAADLTSLGTRVTSLETARVALDTDGVPYLSL